MYSFVLYVLQGCPYCASAIALLRERGEPYRLYVVPRNLKESYKAKNGMNTFPQIFLERAVGNQTTITKIGGNDALHAMYGVR